MRLVLVLCLVACGTKQWSLQKNRERIATGTAEQRYHSTLDLYRYDDREELVRLLASSEPMTRNAAARALCELGEQSAARALIENLHRDQRTFVATDAIYHLRCVFGTGLGYEPNLGYRHQTEKQRAWWDWWAEQPFGREVPQDDPDADRRALRRAAFDDRIEAFAARDDPTREEMLAFWKETADRGRSRHPDDVADDMRVFALLVERWPENADLWNNHALAALNNGEWDIAEESYQRALKLKPGDPSLHNDLGILFEGLGRFAEAEAHYREAFHLAPDDDIAAANLADVLRERGRHDEAVKMYRAAERLAPDKWMYHRIWIRRLKASPSSPR